MEGITNSGPSASVNCIPWVYVPEILPLQARAKGRFRQIMAGSSSVLTASSGTAIGIGSNWLWASIPKIIPSNSLS